MAFHILKIKISLKKIVKLKIFGLNKEKNTKNLFDIQKVRIFFNGVAFLEYFLEIFFEVFLLLLKYQIFSNIFLSKNRKLPTFNRIEGKIFENILII